MPDTPSSPSSDERPLRVLLAGGGTAGHVNPLLATAAALRDERLGGDPRCEVLILGTAEGLESQLVPQAGYEMATVPRVPMPRRPTGDLLMLPRRLSRAIAEGVRIVIVRALIDKFRALAQYAEAVGESGRNPLL